MRLVIVTGTRPHHKHLCAVLAAKFDVAAIIHPGVERRSPIEIARRLIRQTNRDGMMITGLYGLEKAISRLSPKSGNPAAAVDFSDGVREYEALQQRLIHAQADVRSQKAENLVRSVKPDVTVCLGGPLYPQSFVNASPLTLNYHSGISPIYNGSASIQFAFANGHPHLCGGTLMIMSGAVDGGNILGHYLSPIEAGDSPESLFGKTVSGASKMYVSLLEHLERIGSRLISVPQPRPLFYTRGADFNWSHRQMIRRNLRNNICARYARSEAIIEYWRENDTAAARDQYQATVNRLLWGSDHSE